MPPSPRRCAASSTARWQAPSRSPRKATAATGRFSTGCAGRSAISSSPSPTTGSPSGSTSGTWGCLGRKPAKAGIPGRDVTAGLPEVPAFAGMTLVPPGPEEGGGRHVDPFEAAVDAVEIGRDEVAHLGRELVDEEGAAGPERLGSLLGDLRPDPRRQGREGQAGEDVIGMLEAEIAHDLAHIRGRPGDGAKPGIADLRGQIGGEIRI